MLTLTREKPGLGHIEAEPHFAMKDGHLVMAIEHRFEDMPIWVEWDEKQQFLRIAQMGGQVDTAKVKISRDHYQALRSWRKLLLVTNYRGEKIIHYVPFIIRR